MNTYKVQKVFAGYYVMSFDGHRVVIVNKGVQTAYAAKTRQGGYWVAQGQDVRADMTQNPQSEPLVSKRDAVEAARQIMDQLVSAI